MKREGSYKWWPGFAAVLFVLVFLGTMIPYSAALAQFERPEFKKVSNEARHQFMQRFTEIKWTGQGLNRRTGIDDLQTNVLRARLEARFGDPTVKIEDLIHNDNFRLGQAIQFEYRFTVNDSIPMMILDVFGPFGRGLTYVGASRYVDLMPQIKRSFSQELLGVEKLAEYSDYYYSADREEWYRVSYKNGNFRTEKIDPPQGMRINGN